MALGAKGPVQSLVRELKSHKSCGQRKDPYTDTHINTHTLVYRHIHSHTVAHVPMERPPAAHAGGVCRHDTFMCADTLAPGQPLPPAPQP